MITLYQPPFEIYVDSQLRAVAQNVGKGDPQQLFLRTDRAYALHICGNERQESLFLMEGPQQDGIVDGLLLIPVQSTPKVVNLRTRFNGNTGLVLHFVNQGETKTKGFNTAGIHSVMIKG